MFIKKQTQKTQHFIQKTLDWDKTRMTSYLVNPRTQTGDLLAGEQNH